ncbi:MAG: efflux RND transporter permease subunit [Silanimonas sp.]
MWIVLYALQRKYSIGVLAILLLLFGILSMRQMSTDVLPEVETPSINVIWTYQGLNAAEMASKITTFGETVILNNVDDVREVRSETLSGVAVIRVDFQPGVAVDVALSQVTAVSQTILRRMPPGVSPPLIVRNIQSSTPILQLVLSSDTLTDGALFDYARLQLRAQIQAIPGIRLTLPYGGAARQVMVDLDPLRLSQYGLTAADVAAAIARQAPTLPSGAIREGSREIQITLDASPESVAGFADLPVRQGASGVVYVRDVATVRDGEALQTSLARLDGNNAAIVSIIKLGGASTVDIVRAINERLPQIRASAPDGLRIEPIFDQSVFVENAVAHVRFEGLIVGLLVALVVLLALGSWRSTIIVLASIPLSLLASVVGLHLLGHTFNVMTLGGLALAIGILVDNALVEIENINRHLDMGKPVRRAIIDGAQQIVFPEFVSTLAICIVFMPMFLLTGTSAYVFAPLALAVIFAMAASFLLSRTLVPTLALMLLPADRASRATQAASPGLLLRTNHRVEHGLDALRDRHRALLARGFAKPLPLLLAAATALALGAVLATSLGRDYFPRTDAGLIRLQIRAEAGTRLEDTGRVFAEVQTRVREVIPPAELRVISEVIGVPDAINLGWVQSSVVGSFEGEMLIQLADGHAPTAKHLAAIRQMLRAEFPQLVAFALPADATSMTLAGAAPTDFEVRFIGRDVPGNLLLARELIERLGEVDGATDVGLRQVLNLPEYSIRIDRDRAAALGVEADAAVRAVLAALGSSGAVQPVFWADPRTGSSNPVQLQAPPLSLERIDALMSAPVGRAADGTSVPLSALATVIPRQVPASVGRVTLTPTFSVLANVEGRDLGGVLEELEAITDTLAQRQPPANRIELRGQAEAMRSAYAELAGGLALAAVLVFLVLVVNFQSWSTPLIAMSGLPVAVAGSVTALFLLQTPLSVPALMGLLMVIGVSTANSVLVASFARDRMLEGARAAEAALDAAATRLRPVLMTAGTMIVGLIPMALGVGEGGEQNAPLGRAVIGGLLFGTAATLVLVPLAFARFARAPRAEAHAPLEPPA